MSYGDPTNVFEPLGIKYIQSYLLQNGYSSVVSENFWTVQLNEKTILKLIRHYKPKIVGISAMTENFENGMRIAEIIKQYSKDIIVVCGGCLLYTSVYRSWMRYDETPDNIRNRLAKQLPKNFSGHALSIGAVSYTHLE